MKVPLASASTNKNLVALLARLESFVAPVLIPVSRFVDRHNTFFLLSFQAGLVFCSLALAWLLRFDFSFPDRLLFLAVAPLLVLVRLAALGRFHLFHGWWRYTGVNHLLDISKAVILGSAVFFFLLYVVLRVREFPRSVYMLEGILSLSLLAGARLAIRALRESLRTDLRSSKRVVIIGAGFASHMILREIGRQGSGFAAVGCVDDDPTKRGLRIQGVPVLGAVDQLPKLLQEDPVDEILIAVPSATGAQMQRFVSLCEQTGVKFRTVPTLGELIAGTANISQLRDVKLDDLLAREPVRMDLEFVEREIRDRVVLVTGAAGSIGSELSRQVLAYQPAKLVCLDQNETGLFYLQLELSKHKGSAQVVCSVSDIGDVQRMHSLLRLHRPEVIFHAAAYKHVPVMEENVPEAVKNNVFALLDLLQLAEERGCSSFVVISSDKAVNPSSIMGVTKRIGELIVACRPQSGMRCVSVRFGNVLGSNGSVVPILQEQLRTGQHLTITHPAIRRFFMTVHEAVSLVLQAFAVGGPGEILVLDMGEPVRVLDLAHRLARLSGKSKSDVHVSFTGLRPGEKLCEELFYPEEEVLETACPKVHKARAPLATWEILERQLGELRDSLYLDGDGLLRSKLVDIVPEYQAPNRLSTALFPLDDDPKIATAHA
ncbi:MAG: polysaccharide biosynthesis protein [Proteobacteria bacterium]|nr:MAG: polysaccharide biosynthesis protein [Pseudomonadota bacterium]